jgi:NAD(P)-dependent dehydrogenase (short-subunit alcohol dehydrogenase family)
VLVTGGAPGVDALAAREAFAAGALAVATVLPSWRRLGRQAGMARNQAVLEPLKPDLVLAYPRSEERASSPGTWHMVASARAMGLPVEVVVLGQPQEGRPRRPGGSGP